MQAEIGKQKTALEYFRSALLMDLADVSGNMADGVHVASAAGVWRALVFDFGGVREYDEALSITPHLPAPWNSLSFSLRFRGRRLQIHLTHDQETYTIEHGDPLELTIRGERHLLAPGKPLTRPATPSQPISNSARPAPKPAART